MRRTGAEPRFSALALLQSAKLWQKSYVYVEHIHPSWNYVNLPAYVAGPPAEPRIQLELSAEDPGGRLRHCSR